MSIPRRGGHGNSVFDKLLVIVNGTQVLKSFAESFIKVEYVVVTRTLYMAELTDINGVGPSRAENLQEAGYGSVEDLVDADAEEMADNVDYLPEDTALEIIVQAGDLVEEESDDGEGDATEASESASEESDEEDGPSPGELAKAAEDAEEEPVDDDDDGAEPEAEEDPLYTVEVELPEDIHYDAYMTAILNAKERRYNSNQSSLDAINKSLEEARYNDGLIEHNLTSFELNELHSAVTQQSTTYKGQNMIEHMEATNDLLRQIDEVRSRELF